MKPIYLYVTPFFPSPASWTGGFCLDAVRALKAEGRYKVVVMTASDMGGDYEYDGFEVFHFPRTRIGSSEYFETLLTRRNNRYFLGKLKQIGVTPQQIAVCHVHDFEHYVQYALALKKLNPKCLTLVHHHYAGYYKLDIGRFGIIPVWSDLLYLKMRREFEAVDAHVFISNHCRDKYGRCVAFDTGEDMGLLKDRLLVGRLYRSIRLRCSYVWYNGVDMSVFHPSADAPLDLSVGRVPDFTVGCVANFNPCKSQIDLIQAVERVHCRIPRIKLRLLGVGRTRVACEQYVREHDLEKTVEFVEPMAHDKLPDFYRSLDLFVMPSVNEGFCCANVEAHACGVPFVAVRGLPMEEILPRADWEKWLVPPHDVRALSEKIIAFAKVQCVQGLSVDLDSHVLACRFLDWVENPRRRL